MREQRQLEHQHRKRVLRRASVQSVHLGCLRWNRLSGKCQPRTADCCRRARPSRSGLGRMALMLGKTRPERRTSTSPGRASTTVRRTGPGRSGQAVRRASTSSGCASTAVRRAGTGRASTTVRRTSSSGAEARGPRSLERRELHRSERRFPQQDCTEAQYCWWLAAPSRRQRSLSRQPTPDLRGPGTESACITSTPSAVPVSVKSIHGTTPERLTPLLAPVPATHGWYWADSGWTWFYAARPSD